MHSKATPNSPFSASFVILKTWNGSSPKLRKNPRYVRWWKGLMSVLLMLGFFATNVNAQTYYQRVYANQQANGHSLLCLACGVTDSLLAIDAPPAGLNTASTLNSDIGLLSSVYQDLIFPAPIPVTQGVILKIGTGAVVSVTLADITAQPMSGSVTNQGNPTSLNSALATLLTSNNQSEIYIPAPSLSGATGTYDRVRVAIGGLATVATSIQLYAAYYNTPATSALACDKPIDVIGGVKSLIDIVNLVNLGSVANPQNAIDGNVSTFAQLQTLATVAGYSRLNVIFPGLAKTGDSVRIVLGNAGSLLSLTALQSITFLTYNGNTVVDSIQASSNLLTLNLLNGPSTPQVATFASSGPFDHIEIRLGALANVLNSLNVYEVDRVIPSPIVSAASANQSTCLNTPVSFAVQNPDATLNYTWYNGTGGVVQGPSTTSTFAPPVNTAGKFNYFVSASRAICTTGSQQTPLTLNVKAYTTAADINFPDSAFGCMGDTVRISPYSTILTAKPVFTWWKDAAKTTQITNGLIDGGVTYGVDSTGKLTIIGLGASTATYYVSASDSNHCDNLANTLKQVTVTMTNKAPKPTLGASTVYGSIGQPVTLMATPPGGGTVFWYSDTTQAPISSGDTLVVGPFPTPGTHVYYAAVRLSSGGACESFRVADTAIIIPLVNTSCNAPTTTTTGTTLGCILCSVTNPNGAIDTTANTYSTLNIPVGLLGGSVYQQVFFPAPGAATDSLRLQFGYSSALLNVGLLAGIEITLANGTTVIRRDTLANLVTLNLLSSGTSFVVTVPTGAAYNTVQVKLTGVANLLSSINFYGVRAVAPNPTFTINNNATACAGQTAVITANGLGTSNINWYADSTTTTIAGTGPTFTTPVLNTPGVVKYFAKIIDANGCPNPERLAVSITVNPLATPADIIVNDTTTACTSGNAVITPTANPTSNITNPVFTWYLDAAKTQPITNGTVSGVTYNVDSTGKLTVSGLAAGNYTYYVAVSGTNRCPNAANNLKAANVKIVTAPAGPVVPGTVVVATGQTASLTATPIPGATISWYSDSTATTPVGTGTPFVVGPFNNPGTYTYYAAVTIPGACESKRVAVAVVVTGPVIPSPDCNVPTSQVSGTSLGCILCSVQNPTNDIDSNKTNFTTLSMPVGLLGGSVYQQLIFPNVGSATDSIRINFAAPTGLADVSLLGGVVVTVYNNTTKVAADTLANLLTLRLLTSQNFVATIPATAPYDRVEVRITGVANLLTSINIYGARIIYPKPAVVTTNDTVCVNNKATLAVTPVNGTGVHWYADSTSTTVLSSNSTYTTDSLKVPGTVTYWVAVYGGSQNCENPERFPVNVVVNAAPQVPGADQNITACAGTSVSLQVIKPVTGLTYNWYNVATGGTKLNTDSGFVFKVNSITADTTFYVEAQSSCGAVSSRQAYHILVGQALQPPVVSPNPDSVTVGATAVLTATLPVSNATITWYGSQAGNDSLATGATFAAPAQSAPNTIVYWAQASIKDSSSSICQSARVPVTVVTYQGDSLAVPCERAVSQTVGGSGLLILGNVYNPNFAVDDNQNTASSLVINLGALNATVWQRAAFTGPSAPGDSVRVRLSAPSQILSAAVLASVQLTAYLGNTPVDSILVSNPLLHVNLLNSGSTGEYTYMPKGTFDAIQVTLKSGVVGALTSINFNSARRIIAAPQVQASSVTVCSGSAATLNVNNPSPNVTYRWYTSNGTYLTGKDGASLTTGAITTDSVFYVSAFRAAVGCESSDRTAVNIKVIATPLPPVLTPDTIAVCPGSNASAAISNPVSGYSYSWYNVANGGTKLNTDSGFVFTVNNVTAPVTYYVEAKNDSCNTVSATRTSVLFTTTSQLGSPVVTPNPAIVDTGKSAILTATPPAANAKVKWYATQFATDSIFEGLQYVTVAKHTLSTDTLWVQAVLDSTGTCSSQRIPVLIYTRPMPPNAVPCERAVAQINSGTSTGGVLGLGTVVNPELAVDNNTESASSLVLNLGVLGANVWQRALFNGLSTIGDTVEVRLSSPSQVLSAALLAGVQLTSYNGNTPGDSLLVSNPLLHLSILSGTQGVVISYVPSKQFDGIEVKLKSGLAAVLTAVDFNYARRGIVAPTIIANDTSACVGTPITLNVVNPVTGVTYSWYDQNGTKLKDSLAYIIPPTHAAGIYTYTVSATRDTCNVQTSKAVSVNILAIPSAPVADSSNATSICASNLPDTLKVIAQPGVTYTWFDAIGNQLPANNNMYIVPQGTAAGLHTYYVKANNTNGCGNDSARTQITLNVFQNALPSDITIDTAQHGCAGDTIRLTPTSTTITNPVFQWYLDQQKTQPVTSGVNPATGVLTIAPATAGTYIYYVSVGQNNGSCANQPGNLKAVTITVNSKALATDIQANDTTACANSATSITATSTTITNPVFKWYRDAALTQFIRSTSTFVTDTLSATTIYYVTVSGTNACENAPGNAKAVTVTVLGAIPPPVADSSNPASVCTSNLPATLKVIAQPGLTYTWYDASGNQLVAANNTYVVPVGTTPGIHNYFVKANGNTSCANDTARTQISISVFNNAVPADINIDSVQSVCAGDTVRLTPTSTTITNPVFQWYMDQQKTQPITTGVNPVTGVLTIPNLAIGQYQYYVSVSSNGNCANLAGQLKQVTVNIGRKALATDIQANDATTCVNSSTVLTASSTTVTNPVFRWYRDAALTQFIRSTSSFVTDTLNTTTTYYVTVQGTNACENVPGTAKAVTVTVSSFTAPVVVGAAICAGQTALLTVSNPDPTVTYTWYNSLTRSITLATADSFRTSPLVADTVFYLQASKGSCMLPLIPATVTVNGAPTPVVDTNVAVCSGTAATINIKAPVSGVVYRWFNVSVGGTALNTDAGTSYTTNVLTSSTILYVEAIGVSGCTGTSARVPVTVAVSPVPGAPGLVTNSQTVCAGSNVTFTVANPDPSLKYHWFDAAVNGTDLTPNGATSYTASNVTANATYYVAAFNSAGCSNAGARTTAMVNVLAAPATPTIDINSQVTCSGNPVTFNITNPDPALKYIWYNALTNDSLTIGATFTTGRLSTTTDYLVTARNAAGCYSLTKQTATATVVDSIATPNAGSNVTLCLGNTLNLAVVNPVTGMIYHWYTSATSTTPVATGASVSFNGVTTNTSYYVDASAANGNCVSTNRGRVDVSVVNIPTAPAVVNPAVTTCTNSNATLQVQNPDRTLTYNWYATAAGGTLITTGDSVTVGPITANTSYYVEAVNAGGCASPTRTLVSVAVGNAPSAPQVAGNDISQCPGATYVLTASSTTPGATFRWYATANGTTPVSTNAQFVTPPINADAVYYVEASIGTGCTSATRTQVPITVLAAIAAPTVTVSARTATSVTFTWPAVPGAQRYVVAVNDTTNFIAPSTGDNGTSHTVTNLQPNQQVTLYVRAIGTSSCQNSLLSAVTDKTTNPQGNNIYVPNLFSPNGDGVNDVEYVYGTAIAELEFRIYNQWGQLVFTSKDQRQGWDGTMSGVKQPVGVYVWIVKATMQDGTVITKKGNVTLMR
ncbi:gliding motility-associated C-terminal domain-containing protein [Chitinophaga sp. Hz27]|uniref:Ig-like domain-containing protein n=1 Tax=Chitinophaga sp. Hz27 TaxID=3347169 RepID=UPI0035E140B1